MLRQHVNGEFAAGAGELDGEWGWPEARWQEVLDEFYGEHEELRADAEARGPAYFEVDRAREQSEHVWHVRQLLLDENGDLDFRIEADLDLDATQDAGEAIFKDFWVGAL